MKTNMAGGKASSKQKLRGPTMLAPAQSYRLPPVRYCSRCGARNAALTGKKCLQPVVVKPLAAETSSEPLYGREKQSNLGHSMVSAPVQGKQHDYVHLSDIPASLNRLADTVVMLKTTMESM